MPVWKVDMQALATITVEVEADTAEQAAENAAGQEICAQCSGWGRDFYWSSMTKVARIYVAQSD